MWDLSGDEREDRQRGRQKGRGWDVEKLAHTTVVGEQAGSAQQSKHTAGLL